MNPLGLTPVVSPHARRTGGLALLLLAGVVAAASGLGPAGAQDQKKAPVPAGRFVPSPAGGVIDTLSGAEYYPDPEAAGQSVALDLVGASAFVRPIVVDTTGWGSIEIPRVDPSISADRDRFFAPTGRPHEVLDTRTGAVYALGAARGPVSGWKGVSVVRLDSVLGTRVERPLAVSKRGG